MIKWNQIIDKYIKSNNELNIDEIKILKNTAKAANLLNDKIYLYTLDEIIEWCSDFDNQNKLDMYNNYLSELNPGYRLLDWINFFNIEEINQKKLELQQSINNINKNAILTKGMAEGSLKDIKEIVNIQAKSNDNQDNIFIYTNVESLFEKEKEPILHKCSNCNFEFLCTKTFLDINYD